MSGPVIRAERLGKRFRIGARLRSAKTLGAVVSQVVSAGAKAARRLAVERRLRPRRADQFWALRDIGFEVQQGQVLGIIGRNGSGKSTLLKILARITPPTEGEAAIRGRVGSLLEIGTGFHNDLTGRENIYLSGTILGMRRAEIASRFDEIVDFAGVEKFIDTQVKHFSSGMYLRLAFAVAAHLRTEILLVDEVLAVGDAVFQKKCIEKMSEVASGGRTVLFVSHNLGAVARLCNRGLLLEEGRMAALGPVDETIRAYGALMKSRAETGASDAGGGIAILGFEIDSQGGLVVPSCPLTLAFTMLVRRRYWAVHVHLGISTPEGSHVVIEAAGSDRFPGFLEPGKYRVEMSLPPLWLRPQGYSAWVKIIAHPKAGPTERFFSEWMEFVVTGDQRSDANADRILSPAADWRLRPLTDLHPSTDAPSSAAE